CPTHSGGQCAQGGTRTHSIRHFKCPWSASCLPGPVARGEGLEPSLADSKSAVLPIELSPNSFLLKDRPLTPRVRSSGNKTTRAGSFEGGHGVAEKTELCRDFTARRSGR